MVMMTSDTNLLFIIFASLVISLSSQCHLTLNTCNEPMAVLTKDKNFLLALEKSELDEICSTLSASLKCLDEYIHSCLSREEKNLVNDIFDNSLEVIQDLCEEGEFQETYLRHAPCFQLANMQCSERYEHVINVSVLMDNEASRRLGLHLYCCSYSAYLHCAVLATKAVCGEETADFMGQYLHRSVEPLVRGQCNMDTYSEDECSSAPGQNVLDVRILLLAVSILRFCVALVRKDLLNL